MARSKKKDGNNKQARIASKGTWGEGRLNDLENSVIYRCLKKHKGRTAKGDVPPHKATSKCDEKRRIQQSEAEKMLKEGIKASMMSDPAEPEGWPKYIWAVDGDGEVYEAKESRNHPGEYHGYRLNEDFRRRDDMLKEWIERCLTT